MIPGPISFIDDCGCGFQHPAADESIFVRFHVTDAVRPDQMLIGATGKPPRSDLVCCSSGGHLSECVKAVFDKKISGC